MRVSNLTRGAELASRARRARSLWSRMVGLLGRRGLKPGEALVLEPCSSIHTLFMRFAIDVLYVDSSGQVVKAVSDLRPFRLSGALGGVRSVVELPRGTIAASGTMAGDRLTIEG